MAALQTPDHQARAERREPYTYRAKQVDEIVVRPFNFEFPDDLDPNWIPHRPVRSHLFNGFSLTMPYLEPSLIKTMQAASRCIDSPELRDDMRDFNGQEARHYQCHRRLNDLLKKNGYPELAAVEARLDAAYKKLDQRSLRTRLAFAAGFECMTNGFTNWFINKRRQLFARTNPHVASFWLMHMVEETEHKTVAFDAYMAYSGKYWPRALGVFHGSFHVLGYGFIGMLVALRKDGTLHTPRSYLAIARELVDIAINIGPFLLRALLPWHNPRGEDDPTWMRDWIAGHKTLPPGAATPLVDTLHPDLPVPFPRPSMPDAATTD